MPRKKSIAIEAEKLINGPRRSSYGAIEKSGAEFARMISLVLSDELNGVEITSHKAMLVMVGLKLLREKNKPKRDNRVDLIGYTLLADKLTT